MQTCDCLETQIHCQRNWSLKLANNQPWTRAFLPNMYAHNCFYLEGGGLRGGSGDERVGFQGLWIGPGEIESALFGEFVAYRRITEGKCISWLPVD